MQPCIEIISSRHANMHENFQFVFCLNLINILQQCNNKRLCIFSFSARIISPNIHVPYNQMLLKYVAKHFCNRILLVFSCTSCTGGMSCIACGVQVAPSKKHRLRAPHEYRQVVQDYKLYCAWSTSYIPREYILHSGVRGVLFFCERVCGVLHMGRSCIVLKVHVTP